MAQTYIGYSPDVEVLGEDEERLTAEILEIMATTNRRAFERHRHAVRDAHAKSHPDRLSAGVSDPGWLLLFIRACPSAASQANRQIPAAGVKGAGGGDRVTS